MQLTREELFNHRNDTREYGVSKPKSKITKRWLGLEIMNEALDEFTKEDTRLFFEDIVNYATKEELINRFCDSYHGTTGDAFGHFTHFYFVDYAELWRTLQEARDTGDVMLYSSGRTRVFHCMDMRKKVNDGIQ